MFNYSTLLNSSYIELLNENTGEFVFKNVTLIPSSNLYAKENTVYTISYKVKIVEQQHIQLTVYYTDGSYESITTNDGVIGEYVSTSATSQINKTIEYVKFGGSGGLKIDTSFKEIQIEEGIEVTEYEPYEEEVYSIYLEEPLRCIGDICDYIDYENKKVVRKIKSGNVSINSVITLSSGNQGGIFSFQDKQQDGSTLGFNEKAKYVYSFKENTFYENPSCFVIVGNSSDTIATLKTKFDGVEMLYKLETPQEQSIELPEIKSNEGISNITVTDGNLYSSNIEFYVKDKK